MTPALPVAIVQREPACPCGGGCPRCTDVIQTKLTINQPGDRYEQEADRVADAVMRMAESEGSHGLRVSADRSPSADTRERIVRTSPDTGGDLVEVRPAIRHSAMPLLIQRNVDPPDSPAAEPGSESVAGGGDAPGTGTSCLPSDNVSNFCQPYASRQEARRVRQCILRRYVPLLSDVFGSQVGSLWRAYLGRRYGASLARRVFSDSSGQIVRGFSGSATTGRRQRELLDNIKRSLRSSCPPLPAQQWVEFPVSQFLTSQDLEYPINYNHALEIPGHIAGGVGASDAGPDSRRVSGSVFLRRSTDSSGRTTGISIETNLNFVVQDAIDFCPGQPGGEAEQALTIPLSRLEATGLFLQDEAFAYDVPFEVRFSGPPVSEDLAFSLVRACYPDAVRPAAEAPATEPARESEESEDWLRRKPDERSTLGDEATKRGADIPDAVRNVISSPGQPLDTSIRAFLEPRLGCDFSRVRIHTDDGAAESAQAVNARAYTVGQDIVFGPGQYAPATSGSQSLLVHELVHTLQQAQGRPPQPAARSRRPVTPALPVAIVQRKPACTCGGGCPRCVEEEIVQAKLTINRPGDRYEQEADRIADRVMRMAEGDAEAEPLAIGPASTENVQRQCPECEEPEALEEEELRRQPLEAQAVSEADLPGHFGAQIGAIRAGGGQPLRESERAFFGPRFGRDFSSVRLHTETAAAKAARAVHARAFTLGRDIVFGAGQYAPETSEGRRLLSHELAHLVQHEDRSIGIQPGYSEHVLFRKPIAADEPYRDVVSYDRIDHRPRTDQAGRRIHHAIRVYVPRRIGDRPVTVDIAIDCIRAVLRRDLVAARAGPLLDQSDNLRNAVQWNLRRHSSQEIIPITVRYTRGPATSQYATRAVTVVPGHGAAAVLRVFEGIREMQWVPAAMPGGGCSTEFCSWVGQDEETEAPPLGSSTTANCWEAILLAAFHAGQVTWEWLHDLYARYHARGYLAFANMLSRGRRAVFAPNASPPRVPAPGDVVLFWGRHNRLSHAGLATGAWNETGPEIVEFQGTTQEPLTGSQVESPGRVLIEGVQARVEFFPPPW